MQTNEDPAPNAIMAVAIWASTLGGIAFMAGFFGPMQLNPESNIGPLTGFFLGPVAALGGALLGLLFAVLPITSLTRSLWLATCALSTLLVALFLCIPEPAYAGTMIEAELRACLAPAELVSTANETWQAYVERTQPNEPGSLDRRPDADSQFAQSLAQSLAQSNGVVLELRVLREWKLYRQRTPWNWGEIKPQASTEFQPNRRVFARFGDADCAGYPIGERLLLDLDGAKPWKGPAEILPSYLGLLIASEAGAQHRQLIEAR